MSLLSLSSVQCCFWSQCQLKVQEVADEFDDRLAPLHLRLRLHLPLSSQQSYDYTTEEQASRREGKQAGKKGRKEATQKTAGKRRTNEEESRARKARCSARSVQQHRQIPRQGDLDLTMEHCGHLCGEAGAPAAYISEDHDIRFERGAADTGEDRTYISREEQARTSCTKTSNIPLMQDQQHPSQKTSNTSQVR